MFLVGIEHVTGTFDDKVYDYVRLHFADRIPSKSGSGIACRGFYRTVKDFDISRLQLNVDYVVQTRRYKQADGSYNEVIEKLVPDPDSEELF